ncbi:formate nitrite transporter [Chlorella sorokiniana]|uniref:Formate nitrite transporter n=1 Tax=Chlorella sorokiniana TaxID=3076 RepID=A0A2P6TZI0_CHLSO|nr:formate nitrite transporter [Chlorella sorokiniana]|eukprot:PRW59472.1 formate nitrite transporter [Chlorella sorokiniana]
MAELKMARSHSNPLLTGLDTSKTRAKSEPASIAAWQAVLFGRHAHHEDRPVQITAASTVMTADETYSFTAATGQHKWEYPLPKLIVLGILAGAYIGLGYSLCCLVGGLLSPDFRKTQPGVFNLLFGRFGLYGWLRMLVVSYFSNLVGALLLVGLMKGGDVFHSGRGDFLMELAEHKVTYGWGAVLLRGVLGNWLVCLAVWQGNMARDFAGKAIGVWLPDAAFVSMGLEHCIANMYLVPMAMSLGAPITAAQFIRRNLIPSTLGNLLGGSILVGSAYACSLGSPGHALQDAWEARLASLAAAWRRRRTGRTASSPSLSNKAGGVPTNGNASAAGSRSSGQDEAVSVEQDSRYQPPSSVQLAANTSGGPLPGPSPRRRAGAAFPTSP